MAAVLTTQKLLLSAMKIQVLHLTLSSMSLGQILSPRQNQQTMVLIMAWRT